MTFLNTALLLSALAAIVPILVHWFSRTKYDEVDWAAMQFLAIDSQTTRRSQLDHWMLLAIRCGLIGLLAVALAAPTLPTTTLPKFGPGGPRDVIVLVDLSESMGVGEPQPIDTAKDWTNRLIDSIRENDRIAIFGVRKNLISVMPPWESNPERAKAMLDLLPSPGGISDLPSAIALATSQFDDPSRNRLIVLLTDNQKNGIADETTLLRWKMVNFDPSIQIGVVSFEAKRSTESAAFDLEPIRSNRGVAIANRELTFQTVIRRKTDSANLPTSAIVEWDGRPAETTSISSDGAIRIANRLPAGSHWLRIKTGAARDEYAFTVLAALPILVVQSNTAEANPIAIALAPSRDPSPGFLVRSVTVKEFAATNLTSEPIPRVVIFADVPKLTFEQNRSVENFLQIGGSVLVSPGSRFDSSAWNAISLRGGQSWLPGRIDSKVIEKPVSPKLVMSPHSLMLPFRESTPGGLQSARFETLWKLDPTVAPNASSIGMLTNGDPFLAERPFGRGRSILSAVSLDGRDGSNLIKLPDYVPLIHELVYFLAGSKSVEFNVLPGQPFIFTPNPIEPPAGVTFQGPTGINQFVSVSKWPMIVNETYLPGIYRLTTSTGRTTFFSVRSDPAERDLTPLTEFDRDQIKSLKWIQEPGELKSILANDKKINGQTLTEIWWLVLLGVVGFLLIELVAARRIN